MRILDFQHSNTVSAEVTLVKGNRGFVLIRGHVEVVQTPPIRVVLRQIFCYSTPLAISNDPFEPGTIEGLFLV